LKKRDRLLVPKSGAHLFQSNVVVLLDQRAQKSLVWIDL